MGRRSIDLPAVVAFHRRVAFAEDADIVVGPVWIETASRAHAHLRDSGVGRLPFQGFDIDQEVFSDLLQLVELLSESEKESFPVRERQLSLSIDVMVNVEFLVLDRLDARGHVDEKVSHVVLHFSSRQQTLVVILPRLVHFADRLRLVSLLDRIELLAGVGRRHVPRPTIMLIVAVRRSSLTCHLERPHPS